MSGRAKRVRPAAAGEKGAHAPHAAQRPWRASLPNGDWLAEELVRNAGLDRGAADRVLQVVDMAFGGLERELEARARQLADQRHFIEQVVDALPVGLYVVDREYRVQVWNHTREVGLQGIARGEALGRTIFEVLHRQSAASLRHEFDLVFATGQLQQFEAVSGGSASDGRPARTFRISKIPLRLHGDEVTHVITVGEDVTSWKEAEVRAAQAEKLAAIGQLAAGVMHEINNPMATIAACAESMSLQLEPLLHGGADAAAPPAPLAIPQYMEYLRVIDTEVRRCKGIADALLNFSRARPGERALVDLNHVIEQTLFLLKHHRRFQHRAVRLELDPDPAGVTVRGNAEQLVQVFMALLHNAADAVEGVARSNAAPASSRDQASAGPRAPQGRERLDGRRPRVLTPRAVSATGGKDETRRISVRTRREGGQVVAEVSDTGIGIPRALRSKIFEPFFTTKPVGRGTGLGLSVCYGIVADHGGRLEVDSEVEVGSTFRIVLPGAGMDSTATTNGTGYAERARA